MRVISGKFRGTLLSEFQGKDIRPTADRVRESLFNILAQKVVGARVFDAFCGSGAVGIECISRGAEYVHFNDLDKNSLAVLRKNLTKLKLVDGFEVTNRDTVQLIHEVSGKFDIIFVDPPYALDVGIKSMELIAKKKLLNAGGVVIFERDRSFEGEIRGLKKIKERKYGKTYLTFFEMDEEA